MTTQTINSSRVNNIGRFFIRCIASSFGRAGASVQSGGRGRLSRPDFTRIRRETNRYLSVDYVVFNTAVKAVEERDLALLNQWKELLGSNPG